MIKFIVEGSKIELSNKELQILYSIYIENYRYPEHGQDILYSFFMKLKINGSGILNLSNKRYLFESILCNNAKIKHSQMTLKAFHCFVYLFLSINKKEHLLSYSKSSIQKLFWVGKSEISEVESIRAIKSSIGKVIVEVFSFAILGFETLWRILCSTQYEDVLFQGEILLTSIYFKLNNEYFNDQLIYETFFEKIFIMMQQKESNCSN